MIIIKIISLFLLADLLTGIFHFVVDRYGVMNGKYMTKSVNFLLIHHHNPNRIISQSYWELTGGVYKVAFVIFCISLFWGFHWEILLFLLLSSNGNMIHKWAHQKQSETSPVILFLQRYKIILSPKEHSKHHTGSFDKNYCVMSNFLNPILDRVHFWEIVINSLKILKVNPSNHS